MKFQNRFFSRSVLFLFAFIFFGRSLATSQDRADRSSLLQVGKGVITDAVNKDSAAEKAGLQVGDILLTWTRGDAKGDIESPFDLPEIEVEQAPRGTVTIEGLRESEKRVWVLGPGSWGLHVRPNLPGKLFEQGQTLITAGKAQDAAQYWRSAARAVQGSQPSSSQSWLAPWFLFHGGELLATARQWKEADSLFQEAIERSAAESATKVLLLRAWATSFQQRVEWEEAAKLDQEAVAVYQNLNPESLLFADILDDLGLCSYQRGDLPKADTYYSQALKIQKGLAPDGLGAAKSLLGLGYLAEAHNDFSKAEQDLGQALAIEKRLAPGSLDAASALNALGVLAFDRDDLDQAEQYYQQALTIRENAVPNSLKVAASLNNLGNVAWRRGDLTKAEEYHRQSLSIDKRLAPDSIVVAYSLANLGDIAFYRGDLEMAEDYARQALALDEKLAPDSLNVAKALGNLADAVRVRGDIDQAEGYYRQAIAISEKLAPGSLDIAADLNALGWIFRERGDLTKAEEYFQQALAIRKKLAPDSLNVANSLNPLGLIARDRGHFEEAEQYHRQVLSILRRLAPDSLGVAETLYYLGNVFRERGDLRQAEEYYRQTLTIWEKLAPEHGEYAETLAALGGVLVHEQQLDAAAPLFERALNVLASQMSHLGGSEDVRADFRASHLGFYRDYVDLLMRQKQSEKALEVAERSRAQSLLEMLAAAQVDVRKGVDAALLERERSLAADVAAKTNRRIRLMGEEHTQEQVTAVNREIEKLLADHKDVEEQIRVSSPGYAALTQPQPLTAKDVQQQLLDGETLLLEYSLGEERSYVWAITPESLSAYELPKQKDIEDAARKVYQLLIARNQIIDHETDLQRRARLLEAEREYPRASAALSELVLGPVTAQLQGKRRLVIVSDGALQYVPFAALPEPRDNKTGSSATSLPLMVEHEIVNLPSASVLAVLRRENIGRTEPAKAVAVLADPVFDDKDTRLKLSGTHGQRKNQDAIVGLTQTEHDEFSFQLTRSASDLGLLTKGRIVFSRLPWTRREAEDILAVTPAGQGKKLLDFAANHGAATDPVLSQYRVVHLATHGLLDDKNPELSGLVLSLFDEQGQPRDGFLGLREIYNLNLPVELVVLSGCQTGLGKEMQGEGLVGLTRGFMYAGASRVVASLWSVSDVATAELMAHFYREMEQKGMPPAAALRSAQIKMWKQKIWRSPYFWAAFQIQGEWK